MSDEQDAVKGEPPEGERPEGAPPVGLTILHNDLGRVGRVVQYYPPGTFRPPAPEGGEQNEPVQAWCVKISTGDVFLWRPDAISSIGPKELELLGGIATGAEVLFTTTFRMAKALGVPFPRAVELVVVAVRSQLEAVVRVGKASASAPSPAAPPAPASPI